MCNTNVYRFFVKLILRWTFLILWLTVQTNLIFFLIVLDFAKTFHNCWKKTPFNKMILQITYRLKLQCQRSQNGIYAQFVVIFQILTVQAVG